MNSTFNSFDLQSSWMSIMVPSGGTQHKAPQQGHMQGLSLIRIIPLIWIKILEASWLTAFNHWDALLKARLPAYRAPHQSKSRLPPLAAFRLSGFDRCAARLVKRSRMTGFAYHKKRASPSLCSSPWSSPPHTRTCPHRPAGNMGFPGRRWSSWCPLSGGRARRLPSSRL